MFACLGALGVLMVADGHGERVAAGVVPPGDREVDIGGLVG
jgi:hypothetical protein